MISDNCKCNRNVCKHCKCNRNQRLLSRLHKIIYHVISSQRYCLVCKAKDNTRTDLPIDGLLSYLYTHDDLSVYLFYKHERTMR